MSYLQQSWRYYAGTGANESPWWWGLMTFTSCTTAARCSRELTCIRVLSPQDRAELEREFGELGKIGEKHSPEGRILLAEIIKAYNDDDNTTGLRAFLEAEQANPEAKKLLVPLYIDMGLYTEAEELIDTLNIDLPAWDDYRNFYTIMMDLKRNNRRHDSLTVPESLVMLDLAADTTSELNGYAKSLLDWFGIVPWEHDIEEIPVEEISRKIKFPALNNNPASQLLEATPNPSADYAEIRVIVAQQDENRHPALVVRNSTGATVFSESLKPGEQKVRVNTAGWSPGLYFYSLVCGEKVLDTKKLSVVKQ
jgi:hypothetical protein